MPFIDIYEKSSTACFYRKILNLNIIFYSALYLQPCSDGKQKHNR